ncbi:MAG TPA: 2-phosphosulfolactate phosphatase [Gemmatimonadaceae bacterium]|nr:2-phosphosulfolactate phosphatase [Gemmatimonadaceae bacterium]
MRLEVYFGGAEVTPAETQGRVVVVLDVLRASTSIAVALANGARAIVPCESAEEAINLSRSFERRDVRLAGEMRMLPIPGFDLGNSPADFSPSAVDGKTIFLATTNGTRMLTSIQGARDVLVGAFVNFRAVLAMLRTAARAGADVAIVCAGRDRKFALEDAVCAGRYVRGIRRRLTNIEVNDAARVAALLDRRYGTDVETALRESEHGRALVEAGLAADVATCAAVDSVPILPVYADRQITKLGPERGR